MHQRSLAGCDFGNSDWGRIMEGVSLILIHFQGHALSLSLAELAAQTGIRKSVLLRALAAATRQGYVAQTSSFEWRRGSPR